MKAIHFTLGRCNPDSANGIDKTIYHLSKTQAALGHDVAVFSLTDKPPIPIEGVLVKTFKPSLKFPSLKKGSYILDLLGNRSPFNLPAELFNNIIDWKPDIVHFHFIHIPQNIVLAHKLRNKNIPYCVTIHGGLSLEAQERHSFIKIPVKFLFELKYLNQAAFIHTVSQIDKEGTLKYGVKNTIIMAPNGIDISEFNSQRNSYSLQEQYPQIKDKRVFLFIGRLDPDQKGLDLLIHAFVKSGIKDHAALVLVGPDWRGKKTEIEKLAQKFNIQSNILFTGPAFGDQKLDYLASADVFVHPSRWEAGVPFSVLEALAMRKPCLVTTGASPDNIIDAYRAGKVVNVDVDDLVNGFLFFSSRTASELSTMGENAYKLAQEKFDWKVIAKTLIDAYTEALKH